MDLKRKLATGRPVGGWLSVPSPDVAELLAGHDFDFLCIDREHAPTSIESVQAMVRAVDAAPGETDALVRVAWNDHVRIKRVLDTGAAGIMAPRVNAAAEARELVEAVRYPPQGSNGAGTAGSRADPEEPRDSATEPKGAPEQATDPDGHRGRRGIAGARASTYGRELGDRVATANDEVAVVAQVESDAGVENAGDVAAVPGVDALLVGPADLSAALGVFGAFDDPAFVDAVERTLVAAGDEGVPVGTLATTPDEIERWLDVGFDFLVTGTDAGFLHAGVGEALARYDALLEE